MNVRCDATGELVQDLDSRLSKLSLDFATDSQRTQRELDLLSRTLARTLNLARTLARILNLARTLVQTLNLARTLAQTLNL